MRRTDKKAFDEKQTQFMFLKRNCTLCDRLHASFLAQSWFKTVLHFGFRLSDDFDEKLSLMVVFGWSHSGLTSGFL